LMMGLLALAGAAYLAELQTCWTEAG
jgi:hypothetical protein